LSWCTFFEFENSGGTDLWTEHLQIDKCGDGRYGLRIYNPPTDPDDEEWWIDWEAGEPSPASGLLDLLIKAMSARELRKEVAIEAALALRMELPPTDALLVEQSLTALIAEQPALLDWLTQARNGAAKELKKLVRRHQGPNPNGPPSRARSERRPG
jgi:hypothetical protein